MRFFLVFSSVWWVGCLASPAEPSLSSVEPRTFDADLGTSLTLVGGGLLPAMTLNFDHPANSTTQPPVVSAFLQAGGQRIDVLQATWVDASHVTGMVAGSIPPGVYDVHLVEPRGRQLVLAQALEALDCAEADCPLPDGGMADAGVATCSTTNYRDRDGDGFGAGKPKAVCGPGWVSLGKDCNDQDPLTFPGAVELCNGIDDDCDSVIDSPRCADAGWIAVDQLRSSGADLLSAASFSPGSLWVAAGSKLFLRRRDIGFVDVSDACPANMRAVWAEPGGEAEVGSGNRGVGALVGQTFSSSACSNQRALPQGPVAVVGFREGDSYQYVATLEDGRLLRWQRGQVPLVSPSNVSSSAQMTDLHGASPSQLFAVGSTGNGNNRRPMAWALQPDGGWKEEPPTSDSEQHERLLGLWVLSPVEVVAVGEAGTVFVRSGSGWRSVSSEGDHVKSTDFTSVRAFASGRFYVTTSDGKVLRRSGDNWQTVFRNDAGVRLNDITGTAEDDLWAVGNGGVIGRSAR